MPRGEFKRRYVSLPTLQLSLGNVALFEKISDFLMFEPSSQISGRMYNTVFQLSVWREKCVTARHYADIGKQLLFANNRNRVRGAV